MSEQFIGENDFVPKAIESKEAIKPWVAAYKPRHWKTHDISIESSEYEKLLDLLEPTNMFLCRSDSELAEEVWEKEHSTENIFYMILNS